MMALVILLLIGTVVCASCNGRGNSGLAPDKQPPVVDITISPECVQEGSRVTFTATAYDYSGVDRLVIFVDGDLVVDCPGGAAQTHLTCTWERWPASIHETVYYDAWAVDTRGNEADSGSKLFNVMPVGFCP